MFRVKVPYFHGMDHTVTMSFIFKTWHKRIEVHVDVKTTDSCLLCSVCVLFKKKKTIAIKYGRQTLCTTFLPNQEGDDGSHDPRAVDKLKKKKK